MGYLKENFHSETLARDSKQSKVKIGIFQEQQSSFSLFLLDTCNLLKIALKSQIDEYLLSLKYYSEIQTYSKNNKTPN